MSLESKNTKSSKLALVATLTTIILGILGISSYVRSFKRYPDLRGTWTISFKVKESTYNPYINDQYVYNIFVTQSENKITGRGEQTLYNGKYAQKHFKMEWDNAEINDDIVISYLLHGSRKTNGIMHLVIDPKDNTHLTGKFSGTAANTKGIVDVRISK